MRRFLLLLLMFAAACGQPAPGPEAPGNELVTDPEPVTTGEPDAAPEPEPEPEAEPEIPVPASTTLECGPTTATPVPADVVAFEDAHTGTMRLWFNRGAQDGVTVGWAGILVDAAGNPIAGTGFCIDVVKQTSSQARATVTRSVVQAALQVLLYPPP